jgi:hypothetical protein
MSKTSRANRTALRAQHREQAMRDARDRETKGPKGAPSEPQFRTGADVATNPEGWADLPGEEVPPRGGAKPRTAGE